MSISASNKLASNTESEHDIAALNMRLASVFDLHEHDAEQRHEVEAFISRCFATAHAANIRHFMPRLFSLRTKQGDLIAAFGLRSAATSRLFLESYLDRPIEDVLSTRLDHEIHREQIIEVGNLSALYPGAARWLIVALTAKLHEEGHKWITFTGTALLRNGFSRLGLRPIELGKATLEHLPPSDRAHWGSYYDGAPMVMAGDIEYGYDSLLIKQNLAHLLRAGISSIDA